MASTTSVATNKFSPSIHPSFPNLNSVKLLDVSIIDSSYTPIYPTNIQNGNDGIDFNFLEFIVNHSPNQFIDLSDLLMEFELELLDSNSVKT